jgi:protocatechuate 3,4-dioxygenase beta subunit
MTGPLARLLAQITGLHEVISRIKTANPDFEVVAI